MRIRLPVWPQGDNDIIDELGEFVCHARTTVYRDVIIQAINGYDKFKIAFEPCTPIAKQVLKESEKE